MIRHWRRFKTFLESSPPAIILLALQALGMIITVGSSVLFLKLRKETFETNFVFIDSIMAQGIYALRSPGLTKFMQFVTNFGGQYLVILTGITTLYLAAKKHWREVVLLGFMVSSGLVLNLVLKQWTLRLRPDMSPLIVETASSFPSGHAMNSFVFFATVVYLVYHFTRKVFLTGLALVAFVIIEAIIGFSRIYLGVHYPSDVFGGYVAGVMWFFWVLAMQKLMIFFKLFHEKTK